MIHLSLRTPHLPILREVENIELRRIPDGAGWAKGSGEVEDGWIEGLSNIRIEDLSEYPLLHREIISHCAAIDATSRVVTQVLVNRLDAHHTLKWHRDGKPYRERWHLVLKTNRECYWSDAIYGARHFSIGWWGPVPYCGVIHRMANNGDTSRLHVIIDIDREALV